MSDQQFNINKKSTILLLNPPAKMRVMRDSFCGQESKSHYYWPNLDLLAISGSLKKNYRLVFIDCIAENLSVERCIKKMESTQFTAIIAATSALSWESDKPLFYTLKEKFKCQILACGEYALHSSQSILNECQAVDAVIFDFTSNAITEFLKDPNKSYPGIASRGYLPSDISQNKFKLDIPSHELFTGKSYDLPFNKYNIFSLLITDYGCPYECNFCVCEKLKYRTRDLSNLKEELTYLKSLGVKELRIIDNCFGCNKSHAEMVCSVIQEFEGWFVWSCEMRVDVVSEALIAIMSLSGCHTIMLGAESFNENLLKSCNKSYAPSQIFKSVSIIKALGIHTVAYFLFGLPGDTPASVRSDIKNCIKLNPDFASFSIVRQMDGTSFKKLTKNKKAEKNTSDADWQNINFSKGQLKRLKRMAFFRFYLRPGKFMQLLKLYLTRHRLLQFFKECCNKNIFQRGS